MEPIISSPMILVKMTLQHLLETMLIIILLKNLQYWNKTTKKVWRRAKRLIKICMEPVQKNLDGGNLMTTIKKIKHKKITSKLWISKLIQNNQSNNKWKTKLICKISKMLMKKWRLNSNWMQMNKANLRMLVANQWN